MRSPQAIAVALSLLMEPQLTGAARRSPLPPGMTFLLEAAAGEAEAIDVAVAATGRSEATIRKAAGFFIEQVLLTPRADSYRILGAGEKTPEAELRRHMALLMRWLHPDVVANGSSGQRFDRSAFATRVTEAWESVKTPDRRAAYDLTLIVRDLSTGDGHSHLVRKRRPNKAHRRDGFLNRLLLILAGRS